MSGSYGPDALTSAPRRARELGAELARQLAPFAPEALVHWAGDDESILAFVVAEELGIPIVRAEESGGLLTLHAKPSVHRVALIATDWTMSRPVQSLHGLVDASGYDAVAVVSLTRAAAAVAAGDA